MSADGRSWLDEYERRARLLPALLVAAPAVGVIAPLAASTYGLLVSALVGPLALFGGTVVVAVLVRERGLQAERQLWTAWGGPPTTMLLRDRPDSSARHRRHRHLVEAATGLPLPTLRDQQDDPGDADEQIAQAVAELRSLTRDCDRHPLVFVANRDYGLARNLFALRWHGRVVATAALLTAVIAGLGSLTGEWAHQAPQLLIALLASSTLLIVWLRFPSEARVRAAADRYATHLLDATVTLQVDRSA